MFVNECIVYQNFSPCGLYFFVELHLLEAFLFGIVEWTLALLRITEFNRSLKEFVKTAF